MGEQGRRQQTQMPCVDLVTTELGDSPGQPRKCLASWRSLQSPKKREQGSDVLLAHAPDPGWLGKTPPSWWEQHHPVGGDASGTTHFSTSGEQRKNNPEAKHC